MGSRRIVAALVCGATASACSAAAWSHDADGLHLHAPDLSGPRSSAGVLWAAVVGVVLFGFFAGCAVMLIRDMIRDWLARREREKGSGARSGATD